MTHLRVEAFQSHDVMSLKLFGAGSLPGLGQQLANGPPLLGQPVVPPNVMYGLHTLCIRQGAQFLQEAFCSLPSGRVPGIP